MNPDFQSPTWSDPGLLVLISLAGEAKHGYDVRGSRDITRFVRGRK